MYTGSLACSGHQYPKELNIIMRDVSFELIKCENNLGGRGRVDRMFSITKIWLGNYLSK